jgi:RNA polymerase sigma-70 factor (ECF subfamily)
MRRDPLHAKLYEILVRQNHRGLLAYATALTDGDRPRAEDLLHDALVVAFERIADFDQTRDFASWVRGILRNKLLKDQTRRRPQAVADPAAIAQHLALDEAFTSVEALAGPGISLLTALRRCLDGLEDLPRRTVEMVYFEGCSVAIAAERTGSTPAAAQKRLERARALLHRCLGRSPAVGPEDVLEAFA